MILTVSNLLRRIVFLLLLVASFASFSFCSDPVIIRRVSGGFPEAKDGPIASGSGILIGPNIVLTNRHVVEHSRGKCYAGFKVAFQPGYERSKSIPAKVVCVAENYDLAIIEIQEARPEVKTKLLKHVAPLGTPVRAFGFPLGASFGVSLTVTGGQIARLPVEPEIDEKDKELASVKRALWHDAIIASGSSGGPLFSNDGVLLGLNFAQLVKSNHALSIPSDAIVDFVGKSGYQDTLNIVDELEATPKHEMSNNVVYIEALGNSKDFQETEVKSNDLSVLMDACLRLFSLKLQALPSGSLRQASKDPIKLFTAEPATSIKTGRLIRIRDSASIIQILDDGMLVLFGDVTCFVFLPNGKGAELQAKLGDDTIREIIDVVFLAGAPTQYDSKGGKKYFLPLFAIGDILSEEDIKSSIKNEQDRRKELASAKQAETARKAAADLRRTFTDKSGKFSIDAVCVRYKDDSILLYTVVKKKELSLKVSALSDSDQQWLQTNRVSITTNGEAARNFLISEEQSSK